MPERSTGVGERQYEILRQQARACRDLTNCSSCYRQELALLEQQGMAAWMAHTQEGLTQGAVMIRPQSIAMKENKPSENELVLVLADLVLGDRQEQHCDLLP
jgi:hypothetical protein